MARVTVSTKGQIVIPAELRRRYGIEEGTKLEITEQEDKFVLTIRPRNPILSLRGKYRGAHLTKKLLEERAADEASTRRLHTR